MDPNLLAIENLSVTFKTKDGPFKAVDGVSLTLKSGEILGLVGESGSGKSQLSLACLGLNHECASITGTIKIGSEEITGADKAHIQKKLGTEIAMISQNPMTALNPFFKVEDQLVDMLIAGRSMTREAAIESLKLAFVDVGLKEPENALRKYPHQFSGGQLQRIMIALALACKTKILIADEPTTALDVRTQSQIIKLLKQLVDKYSLSLLFISHDLCVVFELADRISVMQRGRIIEESTADELKHNAQHPYARLLVDSIPYFSGTKEDPDKSQKTPQPSEHGLLELSKISKTFDSDAGQVHVLKDVSFSLDRGECLAIVGESGSGKTTLAMTLIQLMEQNSGTIIFDGKTITHNAKSALRDARQNISVVFQNPFSSLNPKMRIFDSIAEPLRELSDFSEEEIREKVKSSIKEVGLEINHLNRFPSAFSGGQRQRIAIARAFILEPKLIVFDEPTAALDVTTQAKVIDLLNDLRKHSNTAYLFITHNLAVVEQVADRVLVLYRGNVVENGSVTDVFTNPSNDYTKKLIDSIPSFAKKLPTN